MKLTARTLGLLWLLVLATALLPAHAAGAEAGEKEIERVRRKVEALRAWQLTDELNLTQETTALLFPIMREADEDRFRIEASNRGLLQEMERELGRPVPDRARMNGLLDRLVENRMEAARVEVRHLQRVREILSSEDTARYLLFTIRFEREIRQRISRIQQQNEPRTDSSGRRLFRSPGEDSGGAGGETGSGGSGGSSVGPGGSGGSSGGRGGGGRGR